MFVWSDTRARIAPVVCAVAMLSCASAPPSAPPAQTPSAPATQQTAAPSGSEVDALERDLTAAESELLARLGTTAPVAVQDSTEASRAEAPPPPAAARAGAASPAKSTPPSGAGAGAASAGRDDRSGPEADQKKPDEARSDCSVVCRAMASMRRSAARICEILSDANERCAAARRRVDDAQRRLGQTRCACSE